MSILCTSGVAFENALMHARSKKTALISNVLADRLIVEGRAGLPRFWTGTLVAYPAPGAPFLDWTVFYDQKSRLRYLLETQYIKGERGVALVLEPGAYDLVAKGAERHIVPNAPPLILPAFPQSSGWHDADKATLLPTLGLGKRRYLWRLDAEAVLPVVRENGHGGWAKSDVFLNHRPSSRLLALFQGPSSGLGQEPC